MRAGTKADGAPRKSLQIKANREWALQGGTAAREFEDRAGHRPRCSSKPQNCWRSQPRQLAHSENTGGLGPNLDPLV